MRISPACPAICFQGLRMLKKLMPRSNDRLKNPARSEYQLGIQKHHRRPPALQRLIVNKRVHIPINATEHRITTKNTPLSIQQQGVIQVLGLISLFLFCSERPDTTESQSPTITRLQETILLGDMRFHSDTFAVESLKSQLPPKVRQPKSCIGKWPFASLFL